MAAIQDRLDRMWQQQGQPQQAAEVATLNSLRGSHLGDGGVPP